LKVAGVGATFGGATSTHLHAFAIAGHLEGFRTIGFTRQQEDEPEGLLLTDARVLGMRLVHLGREEYRRRNDLRFQQQLQEQYGSFLLIPEGGTNELAIGGVAALVSELPTDLDVVCCPFGTGGTAVGLLKGLRDAGSRAELLVFSSFRPPGYAQATLTKLAHDFSVEWSGVQVIEEYHFGGFSKVPSELWFFAASFQRQFGFALDPIYNAKMLYGLWSMIQKSSFRRGIRILVYHTGGLPHLNLFGGTAGVPHPCPKNKLDIIQQASSPA
jgi:1-aminocyclopropane-1-carboxylate deaminase